MHSTLHPTSPAAPSAPRPRAPARDRRAPRALGTAGDEWLFVGPATYIPRVEVKILDTLRATIVQPGTALKLRARQETKDAGGVTRQAGEEWLMRKAGAYLPGVYETILETVQPLVLTERRAIHLRALRTFADEYGAQRRAGEEWLLTIKECETHIQVPHSSSRSAARARRRTLRTSADAGRQNRHAHKQHHTICN